MGARHAECKSARLLAAGYSPCLLSPWVAQPSPCCTAALLCFAAAWGNPSRSGRAQTPLLPSPQCPAQQTELSQDVHPQDLDPHAYEKVIAKSPIVLRDDGASSTLTVADHIFNFGKEYALIEGWTHYLMNTISWYRFTNVSTVIVSLVWKLPNRNILCH